MHTYDHENILAVDWSEGTGTQDVDLSFKARWSKDEYHINVYGEVEIKCDEWEGDKDTSPCSHSDIVDVVVSGCEIYIDERAVHQSYTPITNEFLIAQLVEHCT